MTFSNDYNQRKMKKTKLMKPLYGLAIVLLTLPFSACTKDRIEIGEVETGNYLVSDEELAFVNDINGNRIFTTVEFRGEGNTQLFLNLPRKASTNSSVSAVYDQSLLEAYNTNNNSSYEAFPEECVVFDQDGRMTLNAGEAKSTGLKVSFKSNGKLSADKTYVIPLRMKVTSGNLKLSQEYETRLIFVKDLSNLPDSRKENGIKVFSCMEVNNTNPLNNLSFTLKKSGKPLVDVLILFSANINYDNQTGRVYIYNNENVQAILDNREHYLKPLQDRGIKVILGILGNHDCAGIQSLADDTAKAFAQEVKAVCDAYHLDGVFIDDEYSKYEETNIKPGFVVPSKAAAARLCYEIKMAQPDRDIIVYSLTCPAVEGKPASEFIDYYVHDYLKYGDVSEHFPGMPKMNMGQYSQEYFKGKYVDLPKLQQMKREGYGTHMIFGMDPCRGDFDAQLKSMQEIAQAFYEDELLFDGKKYPKDWM